MKEAASFSLYISKKSLDGCKVAWYKEQTENGYQYQL